MRAVGTPLRVAGGNFSREKRLELVTVDAAWLRVVELDGRERARIQAPGGIEVLRVADIDGDGRAEILAGWGATREHSNAKARISVYRLKEDALVEEDVIDPSTSRNDVAEVLPFAGAKPPELLIAYFESKHMVRIARAQRAGSRWTVRPIDSIRMATSYALGDVDGDEQVDVVVGRLYGDDIEADGDAFLLRPDGSRVPIPVRGGIRAVTLSDIDGDGHLDVLISDGWNRNYGANAKARLTRASWSAGAFRAEVLAEDPRQYTFWDVLTADLDGDGHREIVTRGNGEITVWKAGGNAFRGTTVASVCRDMLALNYDVQAGDELILICDDGTHVVRNGRAAITPTRPLGSF